MCMWRKFCSVGVIMNVGHSGTKPKLQFKREIFSPAFILWKGLNQATFSIIRHDPDEAIFKTSPRTSRNIRKHQRSNKDQVASIF